MKLAHVTMMACLSVTGMQASATVLVVDSITANEGFAVPLLEATSQRYVDAMRSIIAERFQGEYGAMAWERMEEHMRHARVARFEYRYTDAGGRSATRIYHAMDGEPLGSLANRMFNDPQEAVLLDGDSDDEWTDYDVEPDPIDEDALVRMEANDSRLFPGLDGDNVRAPFQTVQGSAMSTGHMDGIYRGFDAEFKALRSIELDIASGAVASTDGKVTGIISGGVCGVCRFAGETFATSQRIPVAITQVFRGIPDSERQALIASGKARVVRGTLIDTATARPWLASDALAGAREAQVRKALTPVAVERARDGRLLQGRRFRLGPSLNTTGTTPATDADIVSPGC